MLDGKGVRSLCLKYQVVEGNKRDTEGQAQRWSYRVDLVSFADRWVWVGNSFWRLQEDDFKISVGGYSIMENHIHFLLRIDVERALQWSAMEVARRWMALYPPRGSDRKPLKVTDKF